MFKLKLGFLRNEAGGLGDTGGGGDGGNGGDAGAGGAAGGAGTPPPSDYSGPEWAKDLQIDDDIRKDPSLKAIQDLNSLTKSYVHAQRQMGKKGAIIPTDTSTREEWDQFHQKLGFELDSKKYSESFKFEDKTVPQDFNEKFTAKAHELRLNSSSAQKMYDFFNTESKAQAERYITAGKEKSQSELNALRDEWGQDAYNVKLAKAGSFLKEHAGADFVKYLSDSGLGKNAKMVKAFASIAEKFMQEEDLPRGDGQSSLTINDIRKEINNAYMKDDPYMNSKHPDHKRRVEEINKYHARLEKLSKK